MGGGTPKSINAIEMLYRGRKFYFSLLPLRLFACCTAQIAITIFIQCIIHGFMQESDPKAVLVFLHKKRFFYYIPSRTPLRPSALTGPTASSPARPSPSPRTRWWPSSTRKGGPSSAGGSSNRWEEEERIFQVVGSRVKTASSGYLQESFIFLFFEGDCKPRSLAFRVAIVCSLFWLEDISWSNLGSLLYYNCLENFLAFLIDCDFYTSSFPPPSARLPAVLHGHRWRLGSHPAHPSGQGGGGVSRTTDRREGVHVRGEHHGHVNE